MKQISILMSLVCMLAISYAVYAKSSQTFSAGVIAQEQVYPIKVLPLGNFQRCFVVAAQKKMRCILRVILKRARNRFGLPNPRERVVK